MLAYIGPYKSFIGVYQLTKFLEYLPIHSNHVEKFQDWLAETWVQKFCEWIDNKRSRTIFIKTHNYDNWNAYETIGRLALPILKDIQKDKHGSPFVEDEHVPDELKSTSAPPKEHEWDTDENWHERWSYVLGEIIWTLEHIVDESWEEQFHSGVLDYIFKPCDDGLYSEMVETEKSTHKFDYEGHKKYTDRIDNGLKLWGLYFRCLWT